MPEEFDEEADPDGERNELGKEHIDTLWRLFVAIHGCWGDAEACRVEDMSSRWREFIQVKVSQTPSYLEHYRNACEFLAELEEVHDQGMYEFLFLDGQFHRLTDKRSAEFKRFVVDEFIRVYVNSGGFRSFGGRNYTGFVSGSRFRSQRPYRPFEDV